ncbi:hypothetical protein IJT93_08605 [bacterium]|nr:hypothetical protein [bacterium]
MPADSDMYSLLSFEDIEERIEADVLKGRFCCLFFIIENISKCISVNGQDLFYAVRSVLVSEVCSLFKNKSCVYGILDSKLGGWTVLLYFKDKPDEEELIAFYKRTENSWNDILERANKPFPVKEALKGLLGWGEVEINKNVPFKAAFREAEFIAYLNKYVNKVMSGFVAEISHELRNPITCIKGCAELLSDGALEDKSLASKWMAIITEETERLQRMVGNLYELSVLELANIRLHKERLDFVGFIGALTELWQVKVLKSRLSLRFDSQTAESWVEIDKERFTQAVMNIFDNAVKYAYPHSQIDVSIEDCGNSRIALRIKNKGKVIPEKELPYIFDRYFRIENENYKGLGLGLALTSVIIKLHGGCIEVASSEEGTVFSIIMRTLS